MKDFKWESVFQCYMSPGWAYSLAEKEEKIAKERSNLTKDALYCKQVLYDCSTTITSEYVKLFEECLKRDTTI